MRSQNLQTETIQASSTHAFETSNAMNHMINALGPLISHALVVCEAHRTSLQRLAYEMLKALLKPSLIS